jgi:hypothetical protein
MDGEHDVLETIAEILSELPKGEAEFAFLHWKE